MFNIQQIIKNAIIDLFVFLGNLLRIQFHLFQYLLTKQK